MVEAVGKKPLVLIVENDPTTRMLIDMRISRIGCQTVSTSNGQEAVEILEKTKPQILILDIFLPQINGLDLLKKMKDERLLNGMGIIIISSFGFQEIVQQAIEVGANAFIMKPIDLDLLESRIGPLIKR